MGQAMFTSAEKAVRQGNGSAVATARAGKAGALGAALAVLVALLVSVTGFMPTTAYSDTAAPKPGEAAYYEARWADCVAKFSWADSKLTEWDGTAVQPTAGTGTDADPYKVTTPEQFRWCLENQKSCQLQNDLDLGGKSEKNWTGIAANTAWTIDGNGHTVYNLYSQAANHTGLIAYSSHKDFVLKNLTIESCKVNSTSTYGAPLIAQYAGGQVLSCGVKTGLVWQNNATARSWAVMAGAIGFGGNGGGGYALGITEKVVRDVYADGVHVYGGACSAGFIEAPQANTLIEGCYAINGTLIVPGGHSGGFSSCDTGPVIYRNCFTNIDVYGNTRTGVFQGVVHGGTHTFENCFASGKIEGTDTIGGFIGCDEGGASTFTNCYSTSMVGMASGGKNMGGFAGLGGSLTLTNCYAAGEVGTLRSDTDGTPLDANGNRLTGQNVTGFIGNNAGAITNCFYDKQTTAMCDFGAVSGTVSSLLTKDLIKGEGLKAVKDTDNKDVWTLSAGSYPELSVFTESDNPVVRACSSASVATALLYASEDGTDYDTVRRIRYTFPLTNNENSGKGDYNISWINYVGEDPANPLYPNISPILDGDVPIVTLSDQGTADTVTSVAPGIGWLQVNAKEKATDVTGMRRMRLVPTTAIAMTNFGAAGFGNMDVVTSLPAVDLEGMTVPENQSILYDHRKTINFVTTSASSMNSFLLDETTMTKGEKLEKYSIDSFQFPESATSSIDNTSGILTYNLGGVMGNDILRVTLSKQNAKGEFEPIPWTPDLEKLLTGERTATAEDTGIYSLNYDWKNEAGTVLKAQGSKMVAIGEPGYVVYHWNDDVHIEFDETSDKYEVFMTDPGCYLVGTSVGAKYPQVPDRVGYAEKYWMYAPQGVGISTLSTDEEGFSTLSLLADALDTVDAATTAKSLLTTPELTEKFLSTTPLHAGRNDVYAVWVANKHKVTFCDEEGNPIASDDNAPYDTKIPELADKLGVLDKIDDPDDIIGWSTTKGSPVAEYGPNDGMPDTDVVLYPVRAAVPRVSLDVVNKTHPIGDNNVGDVLEYTVTAGNDGPANSSWRNATITDKLPDGVTFKPGSITLVGPDGAKTPIADTAYDAETHTLTYTIPQIDGGQEYKLVFEAVINDTAIDPSDTDDGAKHRDIGNTVTVSGVNSNGEPFEPIETQPAVPNPRSGSVEDDPKDPSTWMVAPGDPKPGMRKAVTNTTNPDGPVHVGDTLHVRVEVGNAGPGSLWSNVVVIDPLPEGTTLVPGSIKLIAHDGTVIDIPDSAYNPATGEITVDIGGVFGGQTYKVEYDVTVDEGAEGKPLNIGEASASGGDSHGDSQGVTSGDPISPSGSVVLAHEGVDTQTGDKNPSVGTDGGTGSDSGTQGTAQFGQKGFDGVAQRALAATGDPMLLTVAGIALIGLLGGGIALVTVLKRRNAR